jgi:MoxR-like ATPase
MIPKKLYEGNQLKNEVKTDDFTLYPYLPAQNLVEAVKLAQVLQRPLLVKGEPGCGKSRLAEAVAYELHGENFKKYYFEWNIKSASKAQDGLYVINNLQRLSDANIRSERKSASLEIKLNKETDGTYKSTGNYIELGVLGQAFLLANRAELDIPPVILIDEIDKADIDFPNDLLLELDRMEFSIPEVKDRDRKPITIKADKDRRPLFIITSNDEKPLPPAFLRRCLFHYIDFKEIRLQEIVEARFGDLKKEGKIIPEAVEAFKNWRQKILDKGVSNKTISTSELLDWMYLVNHHVTINKREKPPMKADGQPPFYQALLKDLESLQLFAQPTPVPLPDKP